MSEPTPPGSTGRALLLSLADGRFPAGGYAHSGGLEPALASGHLRTVDDLEPFIAGRLWTTGLVTAAFAAAACRQVASGAASSALTSLEVQLDARMPSPAQRETSRQLGRQLLRAMTTIAAQAHAADTAHSTAPHLPIALGIAFGRLGLSPHEAALASLHETAAGVVAAVGRLLSTDPFTTYGVLVALAPVVDEVALEATRRSLDPDDLPAANGPLLDTFAERHVHHQTRLFAS